METFRSFVEVFPNDFWSELIEKQKKNQLVFYQILSSFQSITTGLFSRSTADAEVGFYQKPNRGRQLTKTSKMEDVDLGKDRTQLIDFVYANGNGSASNLNHKNETSIPLSEKAVKQPLQSQNQAPPAPKPQKPKPTAKPKKKISCAPGSAICLFLLAVAAIIFAAFLGHYLTKQSYEMMQFKNSNESMVTCKNYTRPHKKTHRPIINEEDADENDAIKQPTKEELALPKHVQPIWYDVSLFPKAGGNGTMGLALVKLNITEPTNKIVLNAKGIEFTKNLEKIQLSREAVKRSKKSLENSTNGTSDVTEGSGMNSDEETTTTTTESTPVSSLVDTGIKITGIEFNEDLEKVTLTLDQELKKGSDIVLKIPFTSKVTNDNGLKEYKYKNSDGEEKSMFTTQPSYAYLRHVFPSFDQEAFKAPAALTLMHSNGSIVVANTEVKTEDDGDSMTSTLKKVLDPDFVIGDLVASEVNTTSGLTVRIWTRPEVQHYTERSLDYANQAIDALEHILQSRLESKSLDIVAVPGFQHGNRVSPSFIVLPEEDVLYNEHSDDINQKTRLVRILSNRIAAQWFGGITNPEEFGTFWLNEALPKFLEIEALEKILDVKSDDLWTYELENILERDATATSQPLRVKNVFSAADIAAIDHEFIGKKGAAVLRMIQKSVGEGAFNKAIRSFVSSYRTAYPYDDGLWKSFQKAIGGK
uniref:Peptidase_M1 domain-containing protein n=1 Tax=Caenorhabditis tropicalis TaxID=1561998 RepID=A0A1I7T4L0_9PELO